MPSGNKKETRRQQQERKNKADGPVKELRIISNVQVAPPREDPTASEWADAEGEGWESSSEEIERGSKVQREEEKRGKT